ncbi:hypothetical protein [Candidatus Frankia alpina]|uniref:Uncharacterized protein n=1 Tax=Candidatus Frankia alpina TaxID=2699483 RepID=A0A4S5ESM4_9ACTN|nr:hypothetical protein [Candidatus Frankia alpina]THJ75122.1 hypothetical protein E7Y31_07380 [Candidatus Frankia alpina]
MSERTTLPARAGQRAQIGMPPDTRTIPPEDQPLTGQGDLLAERLGAGLLTEADVAAITRRTGGGGR